MPHVPSYNCTPPKGGVGRALWIFLLVIVIVLAVTVGEFVARYLIWFLAGAGILAGAFAGRFGYNVFRALQARTWKMEDASVMSKHDALAGYETGPGWMLNQNRKHDAGYVIGEVVDEKPALEEGNRPRATGFPGGQAGTRSRSQRSGKTWPHKREG